MNCLKSIWSVAVLVFLMGLSVDSQAQSAYELFNDGATYRTNGRKNKAIKSFEKALDKAENISDRQLQMKCHIELAELKDNVINYKEALNHYKAFSELYKAELREENEKLVDSVETLESEVGKSLEEIEHKDHQLNSKEKAIDSLTTEQLQSELSIKDLELINKESQNRKNLMAGIIGLIIIILIFFSLGYARKRKTNQTLRNKNYQIAREKEKSDQLLLNILPKIVADELKEFGKTTSSSFESTTIMFTDFVGFTKFSEQHSPTEIVQIIDGYFRAFDEIIHAHDIEKIKTIGDAYMCVAGIPEQKEDHAEVMIRVAQEMKALVASKMQAFKSEGKPYLEMRIGIHSGPLVAGVVGSKKFAYDVWGDSVNIAARMEQSGIAGEINVSETTYQLAQNAFTFEYRGEVEAKNKGKMKMYFVTS